MPILELDIQNIEVLKAAKYAVKEISKLSDSNIYQTLQLSRIIDAKEQDGVFHRNTILELELSSPYFNSGLKFEKFTMIVMTHKEDGTKSIAIDEFPVMNDNAIEEFYIRKVMGKRKEREISFKRLEIESLLFGNAAMYENDRNNDRIDSYTMAELISKIDTVEVTEIRKRNIENMKNRMHKYYKTEENELLNFTLFELYEIIIEVKNASDYQKFRANEIFDDILLYLHNEKDKKNFNI
jgi:hypothetical protein